MLKGCLIFISALSGLAQADGLGATQPWSKIATLSLGPTYTNPGQTQTIYLQPDITKNYVTDDNTDILFSGELLLGVQHRINDVFLGQVGVAFAASTPAQLSGEIWEDAIDSYNNFTYQYRIQHEHATIKGKILTSTDLFLAPYLSGSIGIGINRAYGFGSEPIIVQEIPTGPFTANTEIAFTYTLGAGFQKTLNEHWQVGVGYEFADWGSSSLGRMFEQTINTGLQLSHLYTHELQVSITYLIGA